MLSYNSTCEPLEPVKTQKNGNAAKFMVAAFAKDVNIAIPLCNRLGLPVAPEKVEGPVIAITFLGIEINSATMTLSLPQDKLTALKAHGLVNGEPPNTNSKSC